MIFVDFLKKTGIIMVETAKKCIFYIERAMKMIKTATRPVQKRTVESESPKMNREEAKIRVALTRNITKPANTVKTDTIFYKHEAGRVNFWVKLNDSNNYDIVSYYFSYDNLQIKLFDEKDVCKILEI